MSPYWEPMAWVCSSILGIVAIGRLVVECAKYALEKRKARDDQNQESAGLIRSFQDADLIDAKRGYVVPFCSNIDPSHQDDLRNTVGVKQNVFDALGEELNADGKCHILVLADSGMGKTTLLLNLWQKEQSKPVQKRRRIALIPLGQGNALEQIKNIKDQRNTVLFLDAFDEDSEAIDDAEQRLSLIMDAAADFRAVVMTCRTQFFPSDEAVPRDTGVKRVSGRRGGVPAGYQWRTVYLLPFNHDQIARFVRSAIPWHKFNQRRKATQIISEISDLAARPMLTALIPDLAASKDEVHSLWDLYVFMVDSWARRESSWIEPMTLKRLSKDLAVDLVLRRAARTSERISHADLLKLLSLSNDTVESWKLTGRSLLNRDADGNYKFAHRSIMEFLFVQALVDGDNRGLSVRWTDMMCQLFLSWGGSASHSIERARHILSSDLRETGLYPLAKRQEPTVTLDSAWVKQIFSANATFVARTKYPAAWRPEASRIKHNGDLVRVYDFAEGLVWQVQKTVSIEDRSERDIYKVDRFKHRGENLQGNQEWMVPELSEMRSLIEILCSSDSLADVLDERELYWVADTDGDYCAVLRIRTSPDEETVKFNGLTLVSSVSGVTKSTRYAVDVYKADVRGKSVSTLQALPIMAMHGDAEAVWHFDLSDKQLNWAITPSVTFVPHVKFNSGHGLVSKRKHPNTSESPTI